MKKSLKAFVILVSVLCMGSCDGAHDPSGDGLGLITMPPSLDLSLKFIDGKYPPVIALDTTSVQDGVIGKADFYYVKSSEGFDNMGEPTIYDMRLSSKGILMDVQNSSDRLYVKVLGKCEGYADTFLEVVVRNWIFDRNYIAPQTLTGSFDGLDIILDRNYQDATAELPEMVTYPRVGYVGMNSGSASVRTTMGGDVWMYANFFGGSFKNTVFSMSGPDEIIYEINMPGSVYYYENSIKKSVYAGEVGKGDKLSCSWSSKIWLEDVAVLEQQQYKSHRDSVVSGGLIEDLQ